MDDQLANLDPSPENNSPKKITIFILIIFAVISSFLGGVIVTRLTFIPKTTPETTRITPLPKPPETIKFIPGNFYFDDGIFAVTKDEPRQVIIASVSRIQQEGGQYNQTSRVVRMDGVANQRLVNSQTLNNFEIKPDEVVRRWETTIDPSWVLREESKIALVIGKTNYVIRTGNLENELAIRSLPGYTKFYSQGDGELIIDNVVHKAHILYSRLYSLNSRDIQFYTKNLGLKTNFLAFWANNGSFYLVDATTVAKSEFNYKTHQVGFKESQNKAVWRTFTTPVVTDGNVPPKTSTFSFGQPIGETIKVSSVTSIDKAPNEDYRWYLSLIAGENNSGVGIAEHIQD